MINRFSHSRLGNISFIALVTISYFVHRSAALIRDKCDIVPRTIKLISPRPLLVVTYTTCTKVAFTHFLAPFPDDISGKSS